MKKLLIIALLVFVSPCWAQITIVDSDTLVSEDVPAAITWPSVIIATPEGNVSATNPLPVDAEVSIGSITVEAFPVFADSAGEPATATIDADSRAVVNVGSETIGLLDKLDEIKAATASETKLINKLDALQTATASETKLINKLDALQTATASETTLIDSIRGVPTSCSISTVSIPGNTMFLISTLLDNVAISIFNNSDSATLWVRPDGEDVTVGTGIPVQPRGFVSFKHGRLPAISVIADGEMSVTTYLEGR